MWLYVPTNYREALPDDCNILSFCSGGGGLDDSLKLALRGARTVCYVEREAPAVQALVSRMEEGSLDAAPVFSDAGAFDGRGWRGRVHGVIGGTSCQDLSLAGKRAGLSGKRSGVFWKFLRAIRQIQPEWVLWENVGGATSALPAVASAFARRGYRGAWLRIRASDVGAPHERARVFLLAYRASLPQREPHHTQRTEPRQRTREDAVRGGLRLHAPSLAPLFEPATGKLADRAGIGCKLGRGTGEGEPWNVVTAKEGGGLHAAPLGHVCGEGREERRPLGGDGAEEQPAPERTGLGLGPFPPGPDDLDLWAGILRAAPYLAPAAPESLVQRVVDGLGLAARQDLLRLLGNGVVPQQAAAAVLILAHHLEHGSGTMKAKRTTKREAA